MSACLRRLAARLRHDKSGVALTEFAFAFPLILAVGGWGIELSFYALTNLRVSQYALNLADNASRVGIAASGGVTQLREADINDVLQGIRVDGKSIDLTTNGRVTLSSLENVQRSFPDGTSDSAPVQRLHWQRCIGMMGSDDYESHYGKAAPSDGSDASRANAGVRMDDGMGETGRKVKAMDGSGVMVVEINYRYKQAFGTLFMGQPIIRYSASFVVRDNRDYTHVYSSPDVSASTCDKHST